MASMASLAMGKRMSPKLASVSWALSTMELNFPKVEVESFSIMPLNLPPSSVIRLKACSSSGNPTFPSLTKSRTSVSATPKTFARDCNTGIPRPWNWLMSSAKSLPWTFAFP